jgi:predicted dithiol-disulfide oxidoreductase (DUF899 family)
MTNHQVVSPEAWVAARKQLLTKEKEFTRLRDQLSQGRRDLPWVQVTKHPEGKQTLGQLFNGRSQLIVYHFMFGPDWEVGCKSCSFWADNFNGIVPHLNHCDVTFVAVSRAPLAKLQAFATRLGWSFKWVSSSRSDFNYDYNVSFTPEDLADGSAIYNYAANKMNMPELPGTACSSKTPRARSFTPIPATRAAWTC